MSRLGSWLVHRVYRPYLLRFPLFESGAYLLKYLLLPWLRGRGNAAYRPPTWRRETGAALSSPLRIALIADSMTEMNFRCFAEIIPLTPQNWRRQMEEHHPDLFLCESAWRGRDESWAYRVHRNKRLLFDNRTALKRILRYCKAANLTTFFWNKEDPTFFDDPVNSFSDTATLFDRVFTTARECIPRYERMGCRADVLMFGFSPALFSPVPLEDGENRAAFFGGWYADQPERCEAMRRVFRFVREQGLELIIYDRFWGTEEEKNRYPAEYDPFRRPPVSYDKVREELRHAAYAVSVSTETGSETMFARRVIEIMACGRLVISNDSRGLRDRFPGHIWFAGEDFDRSREAQVIRENQETVFREYVFQRLFEQALSRAGYPVRSNEQKEEGL